MIRLDDCRFALWRSSENEITFFAQMGRFFASRTVRRECGNYPLDDGPRYRWFVVQNAQASHVLGFISVEHLGDRLHMRQGYVRPEARGVGLFRTLRDTVLAYADKQDLPLLTRIPTRCVPFLLAHGFTVQGERGTWTTLMRIRHARSKTIDPGRRDPVPEAGHLAALPPCGTDQHPAATIARA
ncbi:N-acetyltransferase [Pseudomonas sp. RW10S2]|uniref:N-acetyltransferase n=1 Tax=Pseudomonas sp. RW10S2 TaxID=459637 RepID=UPI001EE1B43B|nr:N-acetyltransferase [Pseudomonas sp. RW10S2]